MYFCIIEKSLQLKLWVCKSVYLWFSIFVSIFAAVFSKCSIPAIWRLSLEAVTASAAAKQKYKLGLMGNTLD